MKLSLVACLGAPMSFAMAQSSLTLYGRADASIGREINSNGQIREGQGEGSLLGFKGNENLGGGYSVFFDLQSSITLQNGVQTGGTGVNGAAGFFDSKSIIGVANQYGSIDFGRKLTPAWVVFIMGDPFGTYQYVSRNNAGLHGNHLFSSARNQNAGSVNLNLNGFFASVQIAQSDPKVVWATPPTIQTPLVKSIGVTGALPVSAAVGYSQGPLYVGFGYEATAYSTKAVGATAIYDWGVVKASIGVQAGGYTAPGTDKMQVKAINTLAALYVPFGAGTWLLSYDVLNTKVLNTAGNYDSYTTYPWISRKLGAGYQYHLSKATFLYADLVYDKRAPSGRAGWDVGLTHHF
ncbi:porin [Paraburkholderia sp.]|uniref:porin n=1 Tax=Paraburkholderia sp. TaxID=1926495 RepID=UPI00239A1760|nr:porin [Paraburkholderia sp.]MDE1179333.1 porin [Paraburkholderia sp.]